MDPETARLSRLKLIRCARRASNRITPLALKWLVQLIGDFRFPSFFLYFGRLQKFNILIQDEFDKF